jgi:hypothetical protein
MRTQLSRALATAGAVSIILAAVPPIRAAGQSDPVPSLGTRETIKSTVLGEDRTLWIWTPPGHSRGGPALPVLYVLDADVHYRNVTGLAHFLAHYLRTPEMIVVGVLNTNRGRDFTPPRGTADSAGNSGGADRFLRFLIEEVRPHVARTYRAAPFSILAGHSLGGLFTVHTAFSRPDAFGAYIAISPSLDWSDSITLRSARSTLARGGDLPRFLFLGVAENERPGIATSTRSLADALGSTASAIQWETAAFAGENHLTVPLPALPAALRWLFAPWAFAPAGMAQRVAAAGSLAPLDDHYARVSVRYGYTAYPSELVFGLIGDQLLGARTFDAAISVFTRRVELYPHSPEAHDELGRGYEASRRLAEAVASYERALALAEAENHAATAEIRERLRRALAALRAAGRWVSSSTSPVVPCSSWHRPRSRRL